MPKRLTQQQKNALVDAHEVDGLSYEGIAEMYQVSRTTAHRAVREYRDFPEKFLGCRAMESKGTSLGVSGTDFHPTGTDIPLSGTDIPLDWYEVCSFLSRPAAIGTAVLLAAWLGYILLRAYNII